VRGTWFVTGTMLGACVVAAYLAGVSPVPTTASAGAQVRVLTGPTGALDVQPVGPVVTAELRPGGSASGELSVRNQTAHVVALDVDAHADDAAGLGGDIVVGLVDGDRVAMEETLRSLAHQVRTDVRLAPGERRHLTVTARLAGDARDDDGVAVDVALHVEAVPVDV
jgi:hypothetical protein